MMAVYAMLFREAKIRTTNFTFLFWDLCYPLGYLLVFSVGINDAMGSPLSAKGIDYQSFFLGGVLGMASFGIAANTAWGFFLDRDNGIFYEMLTYPMSRAQYLGAKVFFNVLVAVVQALLTVLLAWLLLGVSIRWEKLPLLILAVVLGTAGWFYFYSIFALRIRRNDIFNSLTSLFYFVFLFASSMFYPLEPLPAFFRGVALLNPITWHVDVLRFSTIALGMPSNIALEAAAFVLFALSSFACAMHYLQRQE
jgi:ABC-2 type transport system permease protein